jgi:hypothetical protein
MLNHHAMKMYWERVPGTPWIGGWEGPRARLDGVAKRKVRATSAENRTPLA